MTWTALHDACEHQDTEKVVAIADSQQLSSLDDHGSTPLHIACWSNPPLEVIRALLDVAASDTLKVKDVHGDTPLHIAVSNPRTSLELVQTLVDACPDYVKIANREGLMPLHAACRYSPGRDDIIELLVEAHPEATSRRIKMGDPAPSSKDPLMTHNVKSGTALHAVVGSPSRVSHLDLRFEALGVQTRDGAYPLHMAIENGAPLHVIDVLLNAAPDVAHFVNKFGETPLHIALGCPGSVSERILERLVQAEPSALEIQEHRDGNLPLHLAVQYQWSLSVVVQLMTRFEHAVNVANHHGKIPHDFAEKDNQPLLDLLMVGEEADACDDVDDFDEAEVESEISDTDPLW